MDRRRGIGSIAAMTALIGVLTWVRALRWAELGLVDRAMSVVLWIVVAAALSALGMTAWRYWRLHRAHVRRENHPASNDTRGY